MLIIGCLLAAVAFLILAVVTWLALDPERSRNGFDID